MLLPFVYVMLIAKPVSIRRLCVLFALSTAVAAPILSLAHARHVSAAAMQIASMVTLAAWALPLLRIARTVGRRGALGGTLRGVSLPILFSYGVSVLLVPTMVVTGLWGRPYGLAGIFPLFADVTARSVRVFDEILCDAVSGFRGSVDRQSED
jgi:hypothetical protein